MKNKEVRSMIMGKKLSPGAGCALFAALFLLVIILFWGWIFLAILVFNSGNPLLVLPAIIGGGGILTSFFWVPPLYASAKSAYLQRFGKEALAEITDIHREKIWGRGGGGHRLQVQLDWRWQLSNGQTCQGSTVYLLHDSRKRQEYPEFAGKYGKGKQFPVYFLPRHPHFFAVPAVKRRTAPLWRTVF